MNRKRLIGYAILLIGAVALFIRAASGGMAHPFVSTRAFGTWVAAFLTLAILSFLYDDNPVYRLAEHLFIGVSAAYWMVIGFWTTLIPNLVARLWPAFVQKHFMPDLVVEGYRNLWYIVPLILGVMLLMRLWTRVGWMSRWPLAFIFGITAGLRFVGFLVSDFIGQIQNTIVSLVALNEGTFDFQAVRASISVTIGVLGVLTGLIYFFFSKEHKGLFGAGSRIGIWVLMITFGAGFGYTVMGRVALLVGRLDFLFRDWLHVVS